MRWLFFVWFIVTVLIVASMMFGGQFWNGGALLLGSLLSFGGGAGMRGSFYAGNKVFGIIAGLVLLGIGQAILIYSMVWVKLFEVTMTGDLWGLLGFVIGFLAARREDALPDAGSVA